MAESTQKLRDKFFQRDINGNITGDGIQQAEDIITSLKGKVSSDGVITIPKAAQNHADSILYKEFWEAVEFLCDEWDYCPE